MLTARKESQRTLHCSYLAEGVISLSLNSLLEFQTKQGAFLPKVQMSVDNQNARSCEVAIIMRRLEQFSLNRKVIHISPLKYALVSHRFIKFNQIKTRH